MNRKVKGRLISSLYVIKNSFNHFLSVAKVSSENRTLFNPYLAFTYLISLIKLSTLLLLKYLPLPRYICR